MRGSLSGDGQRITRRMVMAARRRVRHTSAAIEAVYYTQHGSDVLHDVQQVTASPEVVRAILRRLERALAASRTSRPPQAIAEIVADFAAAMMPGEANVDVAAVLIAAARLTTDAFNTVDAESRRLVAPMTTGTEPKPTRPDRARSRRGSRRGVMDGVHSEQLAAASVR